MLPFYETVWRPFEAAIDLGRRAELGLGILSVAVSGASAAALYLIGQGTRRWSMNKRIGLFHLFAAEDNISILSEENPRREAIKNSMEAFLDGTSNLFEDINVLHPNAQVAFETLRVRMLAGRNSVLSKFDLELLAADQMFIALLCLEKIEPLCSNEMLEVWFDDIAFIEPGNPVTDQHRSIATRRRFKQMKAETKLAAAKVADDT